MPAAPFVQAQQRHFLVSVALPSVGAVLLPRLLPGLLSQPIAAAALGLGMGYLVDGTGVSVGLHRHFAHR